MTTTASNSSITKRQDIMKNQPEITDEQRSVLQIKFENGDKLYLASGSYSAVGNPRYATRYAPLDKNHPERKEGRDVDMNWMKGSFEAEFSFIPYLQACEEYKKELEDSCS